MKKLRVKKTVLLAVFAIAIMSLSSCVSSLDKCIEERMEEGYSYEEAKSECLFWQTESKIRR